MNFKTVASKGQSSGPGLAVMLLVLVVLITIMLGGAFLPGRTLFSNDGPLARLMSECHRTPDAFFGVWEDLNSVGYREQGALPDISWTLRTLLHPILFSKFYAAIAILILGMGAWTFFRQLKLAPAACVLGGLAAALNSDFFSTACWGVASHPITVGMAFFAMAALLNTSSWRTWLYALLAGAAVGIGVTEGADVGVIFSIYVAIFGMYHAWISEGPRVKNVAYGAGRIAVVAIFAGLIAAQAIFALVNTQIEGIAGTAQDEQTKESHWQWATRWSLPKREALGLIVPGIFGYRLDTPNGGYYWGALGRSPAWEKYLTDGQEGKRPVDILRQTGSGIYAGVTVVLVAVWAAIQSLRRKESLFSLTQRKWIWFWMGVGIIALLFGFGKHAPFYRVLYKLPYFSTIRNPVKFLTIVSFALVVLFAYGVDGLWRNYLAPATGTAKRSPATVHFDKLWVRGCLVTLGVALIGWLIYANSREALQVYLESVQFFPARAHEIASFSIGQVGWFILFFVLAAGLLDLFLNGHFAGARAPWGAVMLGLVLVLDLGRSNFNWVQTWNYQDKYATNPIIDMLRDKPYEHRVAMIPFHGRPSNSGPAMEDVYRYEWAQQAFQYYNIQSFDIVQLSRVPQDMDAFRKATLFDGSPASRPLLIRRWELTNTRYLLGSVDLFEALNTEVDPAHPNRFRILTRYNLVRKTDVEKDVSRMEAVTAELSPNGRYALYEFTGAMPRAKLFPTWQVNTDMTNSLHQMLSPTFDTSRELLVESGLPENVKQGTGTNAGTVDFVSYSSKDVVLNADATTSCILLLNDRVDPTWHVTVDGRPASMLRCNFFMRGVYLEPGTHRVEFRFHAPSEALHISVAAVVFSVLLIGVAVATRPREESAKSSTPPRAEKERVENGSKNNSKVPEPASKSSSPAPKRKQQTPAGKGKR